MAKTNTKNAWTDQERVLLTQLFEAGHSYRSAGHAMGRPYASIRDQARRLKIKSKAKSGQPAPNPRLEAGPPVVASYTNFIELDGDLGGGLMIACDVHAPATDWLMATRLALIGRKYLEGPRRLAVVGDLMNYEAFSKWDSLLPMPTFEEEIGAAEFAISLWLETFDEIYLVFGNHDYRWLKSLQGEYTESRVVRLFSSLISEDRRIKVSIYPFLKVVSRYTGKWHFSHAPEYSQVPLAKARKKVNQMKDSHAAMAHQHGWAVGLDESGQYVIADIPALADPARLAYVGLGDSTKPRMKTGFAMLLEGALHIFSDNRALTDWSWWLPGEGQLE